MYPLCPVSGEGFFFLIIKMGAEFCTSILLNIFPSMFISGISWQSSFFLSFFLSLVSLSGFGIKVMVAS